MIQFLRISTNAVRCTLKPILILWMFCPLLALADETDAPQTGHEMEELFTLKLLPIMKEKCLGCHGSEPDDLKGDFSVLARADLIHGGESGLPAIVPGKPNESSLIEAIAWEGLEMPPKENDRLSDEEVEWFRQWVIAGAPWPDDDTQNKIREQAAKQLITADGMMVSTSGGQSREWTERRYLPKDLWAFEPVADPQSLLPSSVSQSNSIDYFVQKKLDEIGLIESPKADSRTLIRRAYFDLTGLPPTPSEIDDFEEAYQESPAKAWEELIDKLLASPEYGEHWARKWLDVTRYSDTGGMSNDFERSNMWRYRDYVIRAFNNDKPYRDFIVEQLAGDELADQSVLERNHGDQAAVLQAQRSGDYTSEEAEWIIATGFLRLGPWDNAMIEAEEARQIYLDDVVNITGQTFLSQTLRCCKCHDHKFDPLPTRDYYRIYAAFATTQMAERPVPFLDEESRSRFQSGKEHVQRMLDFAVQEKNKLIEKREAAARAWFEERDLPYLTLSKRQNLPDEQKPPRHVGLSHVEQGQLKVREQDEWIWNRRLERFQPLVQSVYNAPSSPLAWNGARKLRIHPGSQALQFDASKAPECYILNGGALSAPGEVVTPGVLSAVSLQNVSPEQEPNLVSNAITGRRLDLANWVAAPNNPLATRSIVNRIWQGHFGVGIAANANNFGAKGSPPTHPELLDFLAAQFVEQGWSIKQMHRNIMLSDTYQRSTKPVDPQRVSELDPANSYLSHFRRRRLRAEELRDSMLKITGELRRSDGGLPVFPEINQEVALQPRMIQFSLAPAYQPSPSPAERNRRSIFAYHVRGQADPFTELFNQPNPNESCEVRESAAVTPQAFSLLNSDLMTDRSVALANRLKNEFAQLPEQINRGFQLVFGRDASSEEQEQLQSYVLEMEQYHQAHPPSSPQYPESITRSLVEEFSGKPFEYQEILPIFSDYQPDLKPSDVDEKTRALADFCLLLFNANEFMYVE